MQNQPSITSKRHYRLFTGQFRRLAFLTGFFIISSISAHSQVLGLWNFNGNSNGVAGIYNSLMPAVFSPALTPDYNGTVFFGEGHWPAGALSLGHYFEFGLSPLIGNSLNISSMAITMRRSSTGSSGAGPNNWTLRSSVDGYTSDIASGTLGTGPVTYNVTPGSSFLSMLLGVRFRIYGYNSTISSGGLSRLVMENLQVNGVGIVLPAHILSFGTFFRTKNIQVKYTIANNEPGTAFTIERSLNGTDYKTVSTYRPLANEEEFNYSYEDAVAPIAGQIVYYRLRLDFRSGQKIYSSVSAVDLTGVTPARLTMIQQGNTLVVRPTIGGQATLEVYTSAGQLLRTATATLGNQVISVDLPEHRTGVYVVRVSNGRTTENSTVFIK
ncbi:MAG: T9SS type A sorting domain-containing protein [Chitinophagaceae bacterium]|nr:MAG: T9SS type A sorting domain-containing protein [Chitinophagaceae bacterium]